MRFRCNLCGTLPRMFPFEDNAGVCPRCGASGTPLVVPLVDVHMVVMHARGPIQGGRGRQLVACEPARDCLARHVNDRFAATDDPSEVTCPKCRRTEDWKRRARQIDELAEALAAVEGAAASVLVPQASGGKK